MDSEKELERLHQERHAFVKQKMAHLSVCQGSGGAKECGANVDREGESALEMKADHL